MALNKLFLVPSLQQTSKWLVLSNHLLTRMLDKVGGAEQLCILTARGLMGLFFIYFALDKFIAYSDTTVYMSSLGVSGLLLPFIILLELVGGIALLVGWQTRKAAVSLAAFTVLAALVFHSDFAEPVQSILFMKNMAIAGGLLLFVAVGAGQHSLDAHSIVLLKKAKAKPKTRTKARAKSSNKT